MYYESNMSEIEKEESYVPEATITPPQINNNNNSAFDLEQSLSSIAIINESNKRRSSDSNSKFPNNNNNNNDDDDNENNYKNSAIYSKSPGAWSSGLCNFCDDVSGCCLTCWCPCITFGRIAEIADRGSTSCGVSGVLYTLICSVTGCCCLYSCFYRSKIRGQYYLKESPCSDCCVHCFCEECALCQEYRQLKYQGFDMSIGWHGNMERQKRRLEAMTPVIQASMKR